MIARPETGEHNPYYSKYIKLVPDGDLLEILEKQQRATQALLAPLSADQACHRYAEGKWTVTEVIGHLADTERVFSYRALRFARGDTTPLASYDENAYTPAGRFNERSLGSVAAEFAAVRSATIALLGGIPADALTRSGVAADNAISVRACAYIIAGHELHHVSILRERYGIGAG